MRILSIDIETFNALVDLVKSGLYKYAIGVEILLFSYAYDYGKVYTVDLTKGEKVPDQVLRDLVNPDVRKKAFNAAFEIECISQAWGIDLKYNQWECTMIKAAMCGLPMSLESVAKVLKVDIQKDKNGKALIRFFSMPCKPSKANPFRIRNLPKHDPVKWQMYAQYNATDVKVEMAVCQELDFYQVTQAERNYWILDQIIARFGVFVDRAFVNAAIAMDTVFRARLLREATRITGMKNANSPAQLREWLSAEMDEEILTLKKTDLPILMDLANTPEVKRILTIRQDLAKSSVAKYKTLLLWLGDDDRIRGMIQHYGAGRTGRAAGRGAQPHNFPRGNLKDVETPRKLVMRGNIDFMEMAYGAIPDTLSSLLRGVFVAPKGFILPISDYSAIEARVIAWLSGEQWRLNSFRNNEDIYVVSAAAIFGLFPGEVTDKERQMGKVAELSLGYGGGVYAITTMDTKKLIPDDDKQGIVDAWRKASPAIVEYWKTCEKAAKKAIMTGQRVTITHNITFEYRRGYLFITLPSGRKLSYYQAGIKPGRQWGTRIVYMGMNQTKKRWEELETYGGKLVENIVQAVARDLLYYGMMGVHKAGYKIVMHVHDEVVVEGKPGDVKKIDEIFSTNPPWAVGLPLAAKGFESTYYKK